VDRFRKAVAVTAVCTAVILGLLVRAHLAAAPALTANDVRAAAHRVLASLVRDAERSGGLTEAEALAETRLSEALSLEVTLWRPPRAWIDPPLAFLVTAGSLSLWVSPEGLPDPLHALHGGEKIIRFHPRAPETHRAPAVMAECLAIGYAHANPEAPDFFARLEGRTTSDGHGGYEILLLLDGLALDRFHLAGTPTPSEALEAYR